MICTTPTGVGSSSPRSTAAIAARRAEPRLDVLGVVEALALAGLGDLLEEPLAQVVVGLEVDLVGEPGELAQRLDGLDLLAAARVEVDAEVGDRRVGQRLGRLGAGRRRSWSPPRRRRRRPRRRRRCAPSAIRRLLVVVGGRGRAAGPDPSRYSGPSRTTRCHAHVVLLPRCTGPDGAGTAQLWSRASLPTRAPAPIPVPQEIGRRPDQPSRRPGRTTSAVECHGTRPWSGAVGRGRRAAGCSRACRRPAPAGRAGRARCRRRTSRRAARRPPTSTATTVDGLVAAPQPGEHGQHQAEREGDEDEEGDALEGEVGSGGLEVPAGPGRPGRSGRPTAAPRARRRPHRPRRRARAPTARVAPADRASRPGRRGRPRGHVLIPSGIRDPAAA